MVERSPVTPEYITQRCNSLKSNWSTRTKKFEEWYDILLLNDDLEQPGMESVVSNDPRTAFNLAKHLLTTMTIADKIPSEELPPGIISFTSYWEKYISQRWIEQERRYRKIGRQSWLSEAVAWLLCTGWYSIFSMVTDKEIWAEVWSPAECFQNFGPEGLVEHAHIYTLSKVAANKKLKAMNWQLSAPIRGDFTNVYDHWTFDANGAIVNAVVIDGQFAKVPQVDVNVSKVGSLPIFTSPAGGLPDTGGIKTKAKEWQRHYGESIIGTNENLIFNYNKMRSFLQQAARTAAQPHYLELSQGETPIATDELMDRWGSVLHGSPGESVTVIQPPVIPVELSSIMFRYDNELQRGAFPSSVFGNVQQQMSYLAAANAAAASMQTLSPYIHSIRGFRTDIDNFWKSMIIENGLNPYGFKNPGDIGDADFEVEADVEIPGYMVQRATIARMLNPQFRLPESWIMERLFPEIRNSLKAQATTRKEDIMSHPKFLIVDGILSAKEQARILKATGEPKNIKAAELYEMLASSLEAELSAQPQQPAPGGPPPPTRPPQEVSPKELVSGIESLGRTE